MDDFVRRELSLVHAGFRVAAGADARAIEHNPTCGEPVAVEPVTAISSSWIIQAGTKALMPRGSGSALCSSTSLSTVAQGMYYSTL